MHSVVHIVRRTVHTCNVHAHQYNLSVWLLYRSKAWLACSERELSQNKQMSTACTSRYRPILSTRSNGFPPSHQRAIHVTPELLRRQPTGPKLSNFFEITPTQNRAPCRHCRRPRRRNRQQLDGGYAGKIQSKPAMVRVFKRCPRLFREWTKTNTHAAMQTNTNAAMQHPKILLH